jgi:hypothetical protein
MNSQIRNECIKVGKAVNRYLKEMSDLNNVHLKEK